VGEPTRRTDRAGASGRRPRTARTATVAAVLAALVGLTATGARALGGSLSVGSVGTMTALAPPIGGSATGTLPSAQWADNTGLGLGWNGTVAVSPMSYTGTWSTGTNAGHASTAVASNSSGSYTGTADGAYYTVTVTGTPSSTATPYSFNSSVTGDTTGSGVAVNGSAAAVGLHGVTITFASATTYSAGDNYTLLAGTQSATSLVVDTAAAAAITSTGTSSPAPSYTGNGSTINAGSSVGTVNASGAVKVITAAVGTGESGTGYYTAAPGVQLTADTNSWAKTYAGSLTYSIASGP